MFFCVIVTIIVFVVEETNSCETCVARLWVIFFIFLSYLYLYAWLSTFIMFKLYVSLGKKIICYRTYEPRFLNDDPSNYNSVKSEINLLFRLFSYPRTISIENINPKIFGGEMFRKGKLWWENTLLISVIKCTLVQIRPFPGYFFRIFLFCLGIFKMIINGGAFLPKICPAEHFGFYVVNLALTENRTDFVAKLC